MVGHFTVETDDRNIGPSDFETWTATAPLDPRLPGGGGYDIVRYVRKPSTAGLASSDYVTFETDFWSGTDELLARRRSDGPNARLRNGFTFQGGTEHRARGRGYLCNGSQHR